MLAFVLVCEEVLAGYIFWAQKSGIRSSAVIELDQVAMLSGFRRMGHGKRLIRESLALAASALAANG